jgi:hypothetical protein
MNRTEEMRMLNPTHKRSENRLNAIITAFCFLISIWCISIANNAINRLIFSLILLKLFLKAWFARAFFQKLDIV